MLVNYGLTTAQEPESGLTAPAAEALSFKNHFREIVRSHQVCYEVWPEWSTKDGRKIQIGFELQVCGVNGHAGQTGNHPVPGCPHCFHTYGELRQIAEWVLPVEERPHDTKFMVSIVPCTRARHSVNDGVRSS